MQEPRQLYGLGSLVKSIGKGVKKFVKSPLGKAAILGIGAFGLPGGALGMKGLLSPGIKSAIGATLFGTPGVPDAIGKEGIFSNFFSKLGTGGKLGIGTGIATYLLSQGKSKEEVEAITQDKGALSGYLRDYFTKLNPDAQETEIQEFVDVNTRELNATGGRVGFRAGTPRTRNVDTMSRSSLTKALNAMEIPETDSRDFDDNQIRELLIKFAPDLYTSEYATGGRVGFADGPKLSDFIDVQAAGSKSGKQQIENAPKGFTINKETFNAIIKADIPLSKKINLLAGYEYGKGRDKIEKDDQELFLGEGGSRKREIGLGYNEGSEGLSGRIMYDPDTGKPEFRIGFKKSFQDGGRIGLKDSIKFMTEKELEETMPGLARGEVKNYELKKKANRMENIMKLLKEYEKKKGLAAGGMPTGIMRTNQAGVMERDYRDEGGFVPVGIKERADDVPAMLSKNEFVMTADAVRGAGDGSIEKGAQRMYDQMKNLESKVA